VESLESGLRHGVRPCVTLSLRGLAVSCAVRGEIASAARILGACTVLEEGIEAMAPYEEAALAAPLRVIGERAVEPEIASALAAGRAMTESDAVSYACATVAWLDSPAHA
jgi:hypothetical protein